MDELIDILNAEGKPLGTSAMKSVAHREGLFHATVHIWFYTELKVSLKHLTKQESEVDDLKLISPVQFTMELNDKELAKQYVPHSKEYYTEILKKVKQLV